MAKYRYAWTEEKIRKCIAEGMMGMSKVAEEQAQYRNSAQQHNFKLAKQYC